MLLFFYFNVVVVEGNNFSSQLIITGTSILKWPTYKKFFIISSMSRSKLRIMHIDKLVIVNLQQRQSLKYVERNLRCDNLTGTF